MNIRNLFHIKNGFIVKNEKYFLYILMFILILFRGWLITGIPAMYIYGPHDDLYFAKAATYLLHRQWLGPYNSMTLIKVPFFSFYLALSFLTNLPLMVNETVLYILACLVAFFSLSPLIRKPWWRLLFFTIIIFCPASLPTTWNIRVYREFVYFSLTLFVVAFSIGLLLRLGEKIKTILFWAVGLGLSMGAFMLTREEGIWIYPTIFLFLAYGIYMIWKKGPGQKWVRSGILLVPIVLWYIPILIVSYLNYSYYGFWGISEQLDPNFNRVINTLGRIKTDTWYPYVRVTREGLEKAYAVSPLLAELKDQINKYTNSWMPSSEGALSLKPDWYQKAYADHGTEIGAGHFTWLLRDAVNANGFYSHGKYPKAFFKSLAEQLENACNTGKLDCLPSLNIPMIGSIDKRQIPIIERLFYEDTISVLNLDIVNLPTFDLTQWPEYNQYSIDFRYFESLVYNPISISNLKQDYTKLFR